MPHPLEFEIRDHLLKYLANEITLHDFEDWFFAKTWDIDRLDEPSLLDLVYRFKLNWAEYSDRHLSEKDFRGMLLSLVQRYVVSPSPIRLVYSTSSNVQFQQSASRYSDRFSGIKLSVVHA